MSRLGKLFYSHRIGSQNEHWRFLCLIVEKDLFHREISLVRFLGMPIFKYVPQRDNSHVRICGLRVRKDPRQLVVNRLRLWESLGLLQGVSRIVFLFNNTGETSFLLSSLAADPTAKDNTILVCTAPYHRQLTECYAPGFRILEALDLRWVHLVLKEEKLSFQFSGKEVLLPGLCPYFIHFEQAVRNAADGQEEHFFARFQRVQMLDQRKGSLRPHLSADNYLWAQRKLSNNNVREPFVVLSNASFSNEQLPVNFWLNLTHAFKRKGFDVVFNARINMTDNCLGHNFFTTFGESMALVQKARAVVGLRSGWLDLINPVCRQTIAIYTPFRNRGSIAPLSAHKVQKAFSLELLPDHEQNRISEWVIETPEAFDENALIQRIVDSVTQYNQSARSLKNAFIKDWVVSPARGARRPSESCIWAASSRRRRR